MIQLTTPFVYGPESYTHLSVRQLQSDLDAKFIAVTWRYGTVVDGNFVTGRANPLTATLEDRPAHIGPGNQEIEANPAYSATIATSEADATDEVQPGDGGFKTWAAAGRNLDEWALANLKDEQGNAIQGTVVGVNG